MDDERSLFGVVVRSGSGEEGMELQYTLEAEIAGD